MTDADPRKTAKPRRYREGAPILGHFPLIDGSGDWMAGILDWTPEGERIHTIGERCPDFAAALAASQRMGEERRAAPAIDGENPIARDAQLARSPLETATGTIGAPLASALGLGA